MGRSTTPSFIRDPDQAARLAALLRDRADDEQSAFDEASKAQLGLSRAEAIGRAQTIAELRRWADELDPPADVPATPPTHIRPARDLPPAASDG